MLGTELVAGDKQKIPAFLEITSYCEEQETYCEKKKRERERIPRAAF